MMDCPSCGKEISTALCPYCGTDAVAYKRIRALSDAHYNNGLALAKANNLTGAVGHLERSVSIYKKNTQARNLLGVVYCSVGRVGEALRQWVISLSFQPKNNPADGYITAFQDNQRKFEMMSDAVRMYNQALTYLKQKSEDMTIIQLKKATELSPDFVDAHCLLALCYMLTKDKTRAAQCVERALARDAGNPIAWQYFRELNPGRSAGTPQRVHPPEVKSEKPVGYPVYAKQNRSGLPISGIVCFILGALIMFAVMYILYLPQQIAEREMKITALNRQVTELSTSRAGEIAAKDDKITALEDEVASLKAGSEGFSQEAVMQARIIKVYAALPKLLEEEPKLEDALASLETVVTAGLPEDVIAVYDYIQATAKETLEKKYHDLGVASYNAKAYEDSKTQLLLSAKYVAADSVLIPETYYYLGRMAEDDEDIALAVSYFEVVVTHTESNRVQYAQTRLDALLPLLADAE